MTDWIILFCVLFSNFVGISILAGFVVGKGDDHFGHIHLIKHFKFNGHKFYTKYPALLNDAPMAYPLFLHWLLSFLSEKNILIVSRVFNAAILTAAVAWFFLVLKFENISILLHGYNLIFALLCFALTPLFFHYKNARNHGISARGLGLLLFFLLAYVSSKAHFSSEGVVFIAIGSIIGCLIWFSSMFAQQTMILISLLLGLLFGRWEMLVINVLSITLFIAIRPHFAIDYLKSVFAYWYLYYKYLADIFVLKMCYSIWRDLVYDIWKKMFKSIQKGLGYAYNNSVVILVLYCPLALLTAYIWFSNKQAFAKSDFLNYCGQISLCSLVAFVLTSFRKTRFWGEPERYVEMVTPFWVIVSAWFLLTSYPVVAYWILAYFIVQNALQMIFLDIRPTSESKVDMQISKIKEIVNKDGIHQRIYFISNNGYHVKRLLNGQWRFVWFLPTINTIAGIPMQKFSKEYPFIEREYLEFFIQKFNVNYCLLDKSKYSDIYEGQRNVDKKILYDDPDLVLFKLHMPLIA